jgi:cell division protein FtsQ
MKEQNAELYEHLIPFVKSAVLLLLLALGVWQTMLWMAKPSTMPVKHVRIEAELKNLSKEKISSELLELVQAGYFSIDREAIVKKITDMEWVKGAHVRRVWPDTIVVSLIEQTPVAVWNKTKFLNKTGEIFQPEISTLIESLPLLSGIDSRSKFVLAQNENINDSIEVFGVSVQQLDLFEHGSWKVLLSNGISVKAGNKLPAKEMNKALGVLVSIQAELLNHVRAIDLRYPNGVSVIWKDGYEFGKLSSGQKLAQNTNQPTKG